MFSVPAKPKPPEAMGFMWENEAKRVWLAEPETLTEASGVATPANPDTYGLEWLHSNPWDDLEELKKPEAAWKVRDVGLTVWARPDFVGVVRLTSARDPSWTRPTDDVSDGDFELGKIDGVVEFWTLGESPARVCSTPIEASSHTVIRAHSWNEADDKEVRRDFQKGTYEVISEEVKALNPDLAEGGRYP
jgi:hypothetical protein